MAEHFKRKYKYVLQVFHVFNLKQSSLVVRALLLVLYYFGLTAHGLYVILHRKYYRILQSSNLRMQLKAPAHRIFTESLNFLPPKNIGYLFGNAKRLQKHFCFVVDKISDLVHTIKIAMFSTLRNP